MACNQRMRCVYSGTARRCRAILRKPTHGYHAWQKLIHSTNDARATPAQWRARIPQSYGMCRFPSAHTEGGRSRARPGERRKGYTLTRSTVVRSQLPVCSLGGSDHSIPVRRFHVLQITALLPLNVEQSLKSVGEYFHDANFGTARQDRSEVLFGILKHDRVIEENMHIHGEVVIVLLIWISTLNPDAALIIPVSQ
ncbi:hypothetical protein SBRY_10873 [Actinacidiphila bryophytorum]|uniref:Uncharacterized protein n=1 Tax=Actinacidiphila bryophytorum TaxID=1436133 RepID=A0A9W4E2W6_9ACTN|nr:hypothetical protein SBRY_10873 [Actinacidiphila bryophytorum]